MKARLKKIETSLFPIPYRFLCRIYNALFEGRESDVREMVRELDDRQLSKMEAFELARVNWVKKRNGISDEDAQETDTGTN